MKIQVHASSGSAAQFESIGILIRLNDGTDVHLIEADLDKPGEPLQSALVATLIDPAASDKPTVLHFRPEGFATIWLSWAQIPPERMSTLSGALRSGQTGPGSAGGAEGREKVGKK